MNYTDDKLDRVYTQSRASARGDRLHDLAARCIREGVKLEESTKTLNRYVNDCIGFRMRPEQTLFYSENAFGHADAISFRQNVLRIYDLKTGATATKVTQLEVYAALFCLEYRVRPFDIEMEFRLYQNDDVMVYEGDPHEVLRIMDRITTFDKRIRAMREEAEL